MARIRSLHPGQWTDGDFLECSPLARLLALAIRNIADDRGAFRWKPMSIKASCLPADNCDIEALLSELVTARQIIRYEVDGKSYGLVRDFMQWQRPKKPSYTHPVPDQYRTSSEPVPNQCGTSTEKSPQRKEEGGRRKEERKEDPPSAVRDPYFFESGPIRLTKKNFDQWEDAYSHLDLKAELLGMTEWAGQQKNWFMAVSALLAKRNRDISIRIAQSSRAPPVLTPSGNPWPEGIT